MAIEKIQDPIRHLREEHDAVQEVVDGMEVAVADLLGARRDEAIRTLREGLAFLDREVRRHASVEEQVLYPALGKHVPSQTIEVMIEEHRDIWWAMDLLAKGLEGGERHLNEVRWHATALVDLLRRHVDKENNVLFMMVAQMLSDREYEDLARAMHQMVLAREGVG
jgi:hemerythrin-like domain-containing protein